jgi:hypothetical protein
MITQLQCYWIWLNFQFHSNLGWNNGIKFHSLFYFPRIWDETTLLDFVHFVISPTWDETMVLNFIHNNHDAHEHLHITANGKHNTRHITCGVIFPGRFSAFSSTHQFGMKEGPKGQTTCTLFVQTNFNVSSKSYLERCFPVWPVAIFKYLPVLGISMV